jgi:predicted HTH domain antitoxin
MAATSSPSCPVFVGGKKVVCLLSRHKGSGNSTILNINSTNSKTSRRTVGEAKMQTEKKEIGYPPGFERAVHLTKDELEQHIRLMAALKMFELGKVSSGKAAELAGMSRVEFLEVCGRYRVSVFNYPPEEIERELKRDLKSWRNPGL